MRTTKEEAQKTRKRILETALELFASKRGFSHTTLDEIASKAGVSRGAIYWNFKNKLELITVLYREYGQVAHMPLDENFWNAINSLEDLKLKMLRFLEFLDVDNRCTVLWMLSIIPSEYEKSMEPFNRISHNNIIKIFDKMTEMFIRLKTSGELHPDLNPVHASLSMLSFLLGTTKLWLTDRKAFSMSNAGQALAKTILASMKHPHTTNK